MGALLTWLGVVACAALGTFLLYLAQGSFQSSQELAGDREKRHLAERLAASGTTLVAFGSLLWVAAVAIGGITFLGR